MKKSKFTEEQIVRILQEAAEGKNTHVQLCKEHGVNLNTFYIWRRKYGGLETQDVRRLRDLERENDELKKLVAERELEISAVRKLFRKTGGRSPASCGSETTDGGGCEGQTGVLHRGRLQRRPVPETRAE